jgi:hypothetical protein
VKGAQRQKIENIKTYDVKHQNPGPIQNMTYLRNYEAIDLRKKRALLVPTRRETFEIAQSKYYD